jgi:hypothetical protein
MKKRSFSRFDTSLKACFFIKERDRGWEDCQITKISRKGMGVTFCTEEKITPGSALNLKVYTSQDSDYFTVTGTVKWIEHYKNIFLGGIELNEILDEPKWLQLIYFIKNPRANHTTIKSLEPHEIKGNFHAAPPPEKVILPTTKLEQIKAILNYKIM